VELLRLPHAIIKRPSAINRRSINLVETGEGRTPRPEDTPTEIYYRLSRSLNS